MSTGWRSDLRAALPGWVTARLLVAVAWVTARVSVDELGTERPLQLVQGLFAWDGAFYRDLAERSYGEAPAEALRFFPLLPWLGRGLGMVLLGRSDVALLVLVNLAALTAAALLHRLVLVERGDASLARRAAWLLALFPGSFVLVFAYAEALMLVATIGAFLAARTGRWGWAAAAGFAAGLSRPLGAVLALALLVEAVRGWRHAGRRDRLLRLVATAAPVGGLVAFLGFATTTGAGWLEPLRIQEPFRGELVDPLSRLVRAVADLAGAERLGDGLHAPFAVGFVILAVVVARRLPASFTIFAATIVAVALAAENLNSLERYALSAFPLVIALATVTRRSPWDRSVDALLAGGVVALTTLAWVGAYVP